MFTSTTQGIASIKVSPAKASRLTLTQHCVVATARDSANGLVPGAPLSFKVTGVNPTTGNATTGADGTAPFCFNGVNGGTDTLKVSYQTTQGKAKVTWLKRDTTLSLVPIPAVFITVGQDVRIALTPEAVLRDVSGGVALPGKTVTFKAGETLLCTAVTDSSGVAKCQTNVLNTLATLLSLGYTGTYDGDTSYKPSSGSARVLGLKPH